MYESYNISEIFASYIANNDKSSLTNEEYYEIHKFITSVNSWIKNDNDDVTGIIWVVQEGQFIDTCDITGLTSCCVQVDVVVSFSK